MKKRDSNLTEVLVDAESTIQEDEEDSHLKERYHKEFNLRRIDWCLVQRIVLASSLFAVILFVIIYALMAL
jgi:hypothetical protein